MIRISNVTKIFDDICAVNEVSLSIQDGSIFGLIGTNGAGKSTLLRMMSGVYRQDKGTITIEGEPVFDNIRVKRELFYISDESYFFSEATPVTMAQYYSTIYPKYDTERFLDLLGKFKLDQKRKIKTLSKGMKRQVSFLLGICANTKYLFCDETFDGLDPVMRQGMKSLFAKEVVERNFTPVIASHNVRELEDICDSIGLLHKGGILLSKEIANLKTDLHKIQFILPEEKDINTIFHGFEVLSSSRRGKVATVTVRGEKEPIVACIKRESPDFFEILPLSLEEIFISETEAVGYDLKNIIS